MIKKNVYLIYPAGYHGSYLKWAIEVSDKDLKQQVTPNPINNSSDKMFGGTGTAHLHARIPTHQGYHNHVDWMILNRPTEPNVYLINSGLGRADQEYLAKMITGIFNHDPSGVVITINDNNDPALASYGRINCVTKWPVNILAFGSGKTSERFMKDFDPFDCADNRAFRNFMLENDFIGSLPVLDKDILDLELENRRRWYEVRKKYQPHEVNGSTYLESIDYTNRLFDLSLADIPSQKFLQILDHILEVSEISDGYDISAVRDIHDEYIRIQPNLKWFDSLDHWRSTRELDDYIKSHVIVEGEVIREIMSCVGLESIYRSIDWKRTYYDIKDPSWPNVENFKFVDIPAYQQQEVLDSIKELKNEKNPWKLSLALNWKYQGIEEINQTFQQFLKDNH